jgi:hypothetical protein
MGVYEQTPFIVPVGLERGFSLAPQPSGLDPAKPIVRNKPNSDRGHVKGKSCMGKELWCIIHAEAFGKTKPIPGVAGRSSPALDPLAPSVGCTNKANFGREFQV